MAHGQHDIVVAGGVESMTQVPMTGFHLSASPTLMEQVPTQLILHDQPGLLGASYCALELASA